MIQAAELFSTIEEFQAVAVKFPNLMVYTVSYGIHCIGIYCIAYIHAFHCLLNCQLAMWHLPREEIRHERSNEERNSGTLPFGL